MKRWLQGLLPLLLLGLLLLFLFSFGPLGIFQTGSQPLEELTLERIVLPKAHQMVVHVVNGGPDPVTVAQVMVDDAIWFFTTESNNQTIPRLGRIKINIPYPWVEGEPHKVTILTSTGLTFSGEVSIAIQSLVVGWTYLTSFSLLGIYAGVIPVFLGLFWYPFLRGLDRRWLDFCLSLTVGLLSFLAVDTLSEAFEIASMVPGAFQGLSIVSIGLLGTVFLLLYLGQRRPIRADKGTREGRKWTALLIALGIGLHNLGEGLAIGSAYSQGEIALGTFLVVGFTLHNLTEGLGIVAPIAVDNPTLGWLALMGVLAGAPTVLGTLIGGISYSPVWSTLFLAVGAGAILEVIYEIGRLVGNQSQGQWASGYNLSGFILGLMIMYVTGLFIIA